MNASRALLASLACLAAALFHPTPSAAADAAPPKLAVLFFGDNGHHQPPLRYKQLAPALAARNIELSYTDKVEDLNADLLAKFAAVVIYANTPKIAPEQEAALIAYIENGGGLVPLHCASYCFLNSDKYVDLVGAQFKRHGTGTFRTSITSPDHPVMQGFGGFASWDETYVHHRHNEQGRTVLEVREERGTREPWTWVRRQGRGRVFYTAWGHDERTWGHAGFVNLVERGIRYAAGGDPSVVPAYADGATPADRPTMTPQAKDLKPFEYVEADVPFYPVGGRANPTTAQKKMQKPLDPAESQRHYVTPTGFEAVLFAAEPEIGKPLAMNWDERGRLWITETVDYPNELQPEGAGRDRIRICADTDGDGRADKFTVFADKLSIPTSLVFARGGVVVHQAPHTLFLADTNGDDVADVRKVLFTGWSVGDTHAGPSNLRYGLDNQLYGQVGYAGFKGTIGGESHDFRTGFYRFLPDASQFEFLRNTNNNSWGVGISEEGVIFGSTANGNPSVYLPIPNRYYEQVRGWSSSVLGGIAASDKIEPITDRVRQVDHHGSFTAAAGHALYTARTYPQQYWNRTAFVSEPTGHLLATFTLEAHGADYRSQNSWNLLASDDEWAAPTISEVGPDGHVWVIDWYNFIVQHNPTPAGFKTGKGNAYETELRDKKHGRIYRLVYKNAPPSPPLSLAGATPEKLVATLAHDNMFWRLHAQRLLVERGELDVVPQLVALVRNSQVDAIGLNVGAIHALWTLHGLRALDEKHPEALAAALASLQHPAAGVRRNAVQVVPRTKASLEAILAAKLVSDRDGQVQLMTLLALADFPPALPAAQAVLVKLRDPATARDRWLLDAATAAAARHDAAFLSGVAQLPADDRPSGELLAVVSRVAEHQARGDATTSVRDVLSQLAAAQPEVASAVLAGWHKGWPKTRKLELDAAQEAVLVALLARLPDSGRGPLVNLAARWGSTKLSEYTAQIAAGFLRVAQDEQASDAARGEAAKQLIALNRQDAKAASALIALLQPRLAPELAQALIEAIGMNETPATGDALVKAMPAMTPSMRQSVIRALLARSEWTAALLAGIEAQQIPLVELALDQKQALAAHPDAAIAQRAKPLIAQGGGLPNADRQKVVEEFLPLLKQTGDAAHGKLILKQQCLKCHTHSGEGMKLGPDLTGMAVHPKHELLIHILDPSRSVEGNFRVYTVVLTDGRVMNGLLASETKTSIELFDAEGKKHAIQREDIDELVASKKSLMPEGFEKQVPPKDILDLLEFLTQRGQYLPIPLDKYATIVSTKGMFYSAEAGAERLIFDDWSPKTFAGVPFLLVDPQKDRTANVIMLHAPQGKFPPQMPKSVTLPCNTAAKAIHFLSGVSGWGYPVGEKGSVTLIVRLHYADGTTEDHRLKNGEEFADYIRRIDVPGSQFAFQLRGQQMRYLAVKPQRAEPIATIELVKGDDHSAPVVMAVTIEPK